MIEGDFNMAGLFGRRRLAGTPTFTNLLRMGRVKLKINKFPNQIHLAAS